MKKAQANHQIRKEGRNRQAARAVVLGCLIVLSSCASVKGFMAVDNQPSRNLPIGNPFAQYASSSAQQQRENIVLRTKKGDRSVEVELPGSTAEMSEFQIPLSPSFRDDHRRGPASIGGANASGSYADETYKGRAPSITDREIATTFPQGRPEDDGNRREVESGLGLVPAEDPTPPADQSYLAALDHVKQLYKTARYEAALLELDELIRSYPTDPKIYEMRGTLLDRLGKPELAIRSWNQALRFNPANQSLRRFIERRSAQKRGLASP